MPEAHPRYTLLEDAQGLMVSIGAGALGIHLLRAAGLITGGTAGLALLLSYATGWSFGALFFLVNLPFYGLAWWRKGAVFTAKSFASVTAVSLLADNLPRWFDVGSITPAAAALLFGVVTGLALLGLFRHGASLGGVSIVALIVQERVGLPAGWVQLGYDAALFLVSLLVLPVPLVLWSLVGAAVLNAVVALNHRRDWYVVA
jgi:uncharacterized membrane-anchored protein YitT (DUF2179 family)